MNSVFISEISEFSDFRWLMLPDISFVIQFLSDSGDVTFFILRTYLRKFLSTF